MTVRLGRVVLRASSVILVLLALLPLTTPCSTLDHGAVLGEEPVSFGSLPGDTAMTVVAVPPDGFLPVLLPALTAPALSGGVVAPPPSGTFVIPLRL